MRYLRKHLAARAGIVNGIGDLSRRVDANWVAGLALRGIIDREDASEMVKDCAYRLAKRAYKFGD